MATWSEFKEKASDKWLIKEGEAVWVQEEPPVAVSLQIKVPFNTLSPRALRLQKALADEDVKFEASFIKHTPVTFLEAKEFTREWVEMWDEDIELVDAPPIGHREPVRLDFSPELVYSFNSHKISMTPMAPLWGQLRDYFGDMAYELNAGPRQNFDKTVKYQQSWVEKNMKCPFCGHEEWALTYAHLLREPDEFVYDPLREYYALLCPKCERCVEAIPRKLIDG